MESNKLDKQIRTELNNREIVPSQAAWDRLDAMLTVAENPKRSLGWLYIAASIVGFLLIGTLFFNQKRNTILVKSNEIVVKEKARSKHHNDKRVKDLVPVLTITDKRVVSIVSKENVIVEANNRQTLNSKKSKELPQQSPPIINQKTEQKSSIPQSNSVTNEVLLTSVEKTSKSDKAIAQYAVKVNASSLLSQVDEELELSFREKVIGKVSKNYQTVKVALINRNLE